MNVFLLLSIANEVKQLYEELEKKGAIDKLKAAFEVVKEESEDPETRELYQKVVDLFKKD